MMTISFVKMHGIGNDYVYVNGFEYAIDDPAALAPKIADRHFGVGGDGLILVLPPEPGVNAHVRMRMFNADGSESEMCGNGIRCVCKFAHDYGLSYANPMRIQTGAGVLELHYTLNDRGKVELVTVDMGEPKFDLPAIPVDASYLTKRDDSTWRIELNEAEAFDATFVSMGNPHAVIYCDDVRAVELERIGPKLEHHPAFPRRMNIHIVQVHSPCEVTMRTWERGSGITLACGTGASAVCAAGALTGRTNREILAHLPGGDLNLRWDESSNHIFKTGPAAEVFTGQWTVKQ